MADVTFQALKRLAAKPPAGLPTRRVALLADSATQFLALALRGQGVRDGYDLAVFEGEYDQQLERQINDPASALYAFKPDWVVLQPTAQRLLERFTRTPGSEKELFAERELARLEALWQALWQRSDASVICFNLLEIADGVYGNAANKTRRSATYQLRQLNLGLMDAASRHPRLAVFDLAALQARVGLEALVDPKLYLAASLPLRLEQLPEVAKQLLDVIKVADGRFKKCLVLDLDNTLWGGIVGEDALESLEIGELGIGRAFTALQLWAKQLQERGVLLAVCSKNDRAIAELPFRAHPDMVLTLDDFAAFEANWEPKVDNLRAIQQRLNIGLDSLVFLDDNPFERQMVRDLLPEVTVPELPADPADYLTVLGELNLFEAPATSSEDALRTERYRQEHQRLAVQATFDSVEAYLASLEMEALAAPFSAFQLPRIAQLTQRSNQFNLRTVRYSEPELARLAASTSHLTRYFTLADRFGDHGLVGVMILAEQSAGSWFIDTWLMSCRVLKRGMEALMLAEVARAARARGGRLLLGEYLPTAKNGLVADLLPGLGFVALGSRWVLDLETFTPQASFIRQRETPPGDAVVR